MKNTLDRTDILTIPGIAQIYEAFLAKNYKSLIAIATDPEREPLYLEIVDTPAIENTESETLS